MFPFTDASRHWDSRTAPKQPKKPTIIIRPPAPSSMYTAEERADAQIISLLCAIVVFSHDYSSQFGHWVAA